jgi:hypothetical protein
MSDDLVKQLREGDHFEKVMSAEQAADRIEELERVLGLADDQCREWKHHCKAAEAKLAKTVEENKLLRDAVYIDDLTVTMQANDKSTALAGIGRALGFLDADMPVEAKTALRTTLAELKGQKDE